MKLFSTNLERVSFGLLLLFLTTIVLLILRLLLFALFSVGALAFLAVLWRRAFAEEATIHFLQQHHGVGEYETLRRTYSARAIRHLERQGIIRVDDQMVTLVNKHCVSIFDRFNIH